MPAGEGAEDEPDDASDNAQHDVLDGHHVLHVGRVGHNLTPHPATRGGEAVETEDCRVDEEEQKSLVIAQADAGGEPGAVMVHLEHATATSRAMVGAVGLARLALFTESRLAVGLDGEAGSRRVAVCR